MQSQRLAVGFGWGVVATVAMSIPMLVATATGIAPMPKPIPAAIAERILGEGAAKPLLMAFAVVSHLVYGGFWSAVLAAVTDQVTIVKGLLLGVILWLIMQLVVLPFLGWGVFGTSETPRIAVATLVLHLIYGAVVGWLVDRRPKTKGEPHRTS